MLENQKPPNRKHFPQKGRKWVVPSKPIPGKFGQLECKKGGK